MKIYFLLIAFLVNGFVISAQEKTTIPKPGRDNFQKPARQSLKKDTAITIRLTQSKFDYFKKNNIDPGTKASELLQNYTIPTTDFVIKGNDSLTLVEEDSTDQAVTRGQKAIVRKHILEDRGFEISYSDSSKRILYKDHFILIPPKGNVSQAYYYSQVPEFVPPTAPDDPNMTLYLNNVNDKLIAILSNLLNNDSASIANFKEGEADLSLYEIINRRFKFINYCILEK